MLHKAWNTKEEMPYCFPRSSIKFQGHTGQNITDFDPNWAFPDYRPVAAFKSLRFALLPHGVNCIDLLLHKYIHLFYLTFYVNVITYPCPNFDVGITKSWNKYLSISSALLTISELPVISIWTLFASNPSYEFLMPCRATSWEFWVIKCHITYERPSCVVANTCMYKNVASAYQLFGHVQKLWHDSQVP